MASAANRDLVYNMIINPDGVKRGGSQVERYAAAMEKRLRAAEAAQAQLHERMEYFGQGMLATGQAVRRGLEQIVHAAIRWESAWVGVVKVLDGSDQQIAALQGQFRDLAKIVPQSHVEIAAVAAAAAQLGISKKYLVGFTKTMLDLGVATNLTAEESAFALARMMNIMNTSQGDVRKLASAIVALGNTTATTEAEIVAMSLRIAGAGHTIGLSEADVLAFAAALSSVGIEAEAGGTAISTSFIKINQAVLGGGKELDRFAKVAGMSSEAFATAFRTNPAQAIATFIAGLGRMQKTGGDVFGVLESLGMSEIRMRDAMLRLAGAQGLLNKSLATSNKGWTENEALTKEATARYGTAAAKLQIAQNQLNDFAIDMGENFAPTIAGVAETIGQLSDWFNDLPSGVQTAIVVIGGLIAVIGLVGGAALFAVPALVTFRDTINSLSGPMALRAQRAMSGLTAVMAGPWGLAAAAAITVATVALVGFAASAAESRANAKQLAGTFDEVTGAVTKNTRLWVANKLVEEDAFDAAKRLGISESELVDALLGKADAQAKVNAILEQGTVIGRQSSEEQVQHAADVGALKGVYGELQGSLGDAKQVWAATNEAMAETAVTAEDLTVQEKALAESFGISAGAAQEAADGIDKLNSSLDELLGQLFGVQEAEDAVLDAIDQVTEAAAEQGTALEGDSKAARENRKNVLDLVGSYTDLIGAHAEAGASQEDLIALSKDLKRQFVEQMRAAGFAEDEIALYAAAFDKIPDQVSTDLIIKKSTVTYKTGGPYKPEDLGFAEGGFVSGPGGPTSDEIPAMLSNGEFVVTAAATRRHRTLLEALNSGRAPVSAMSAAAEGRPGAGTTINVTVQSYSDRFDLQQVMSHLAWMGAV